MSQVYACPHCGAPLRLVPIMYGDREPDLVERERRGEVVLGGSTVEDDDPEYACGACGKPVDAAAVSRRPRFRLIR